MASIELPRYQHDFRAAFSLDGGFVHRCRAAAASDGSIVDFERTAAALLEVGRGGGRDSVEVPALAAAEDLRAIVVALSSGAVEDGWRTPLAIAQGAPAAWVELLRAWLTGRFPRERRDVDICVLTRFGRAGQVATLRLRSLASGPPGLYPHPTMALFYGDHAFRSGVADAWRLAGNPARTITWELRDGDFALDHVDGNSASAAFAVTLTHLEAAHSSRLRRVAGVRPRAAVSATLGDDGSLGLVSDSDRKLGAADRLRLVVFSADQPVVARDRRRRNPRVRFASNVREATRLTRGRVSAITAASIALFLAAGITVPALLVQNHRNAERNKRERLARAASEVLAKATAAGRDDLQLGQRLTLAASALARAADDDALADRIVAKAVSTAPGILERLDLPLAGPVDGLMPVNDGSRVLAWSSSGHLALFDASTGRRLGGFVHPPGTLTLNQANPMAVATLPGSGLAAVVFQNQLRLRVADHGATLTIFSTAGTLRPIGTAKDFTEVPTSAIGYAPSGTRLLTASGPDVTIWDVTQPVPSALDTCRWRRADAKTRDEAVEVISLGAKPGLVLARGQIVELDSWNEARAGGCPGRVVAPALPGMRAHEHFGPTLATYRDGVHLRQFGLRADRRIVARRVGQPARIIDIGRRVTAVGAPVSGTIPLQTGTDRAPSLETFQIEGARLRPLNHYRRHSLPAVALAGESFATRDGRVSQLSTEAKAYPSGVVEIGHGRQLVEGVASTENAVALAYAGSAAVFDVKDRRLDGAVTWPAGGKLAPGDGAFNRSFSLSGSGRFVAAILGIEGRGRQLRLYDMARHVPVNITQLLSRYTSFAPLSITFERNSDRLLVAYLNGLLLRLSPSDTGWNAEALLRGQVGRQAIGLTVSDNAILRIEVKDRRSQVARYDRDGALRATWSLARLGVQLGLGPGAVTSQLAVMDDSRAAVVLASGTAHQLLDGGRVGPAIALGDGPILTTTQVGPDDLLVTRRRGTATLHWRAGVAEDSTRTFGPLTIAAATPTHDLLVGSVMLSANALITPLHRDSRTALLCVAAKGDLTAAAWRQFVGPDVGYRPICRGVESESQRLGWLAFRGNQMPAPLVLDTPDVDDVARLDQACRPRRARVLAWVRPSPQGPPVICVRGRAAWIAAGVRAPRAPRVTVAGSAKRPLVLASGRATDTYGQPTQVAELIDGHGTPVAGFSTTGGAIGLVGDRVMATKRVAGLLLTTTYVMDRRGAGFAPRDEVPVGAAPLAGSTRPARG